MWDKYKYIRNNASDCMKKSRNDSLYEVGKYEQFTDSMNVKKANKLPKVKNFYLELACRPWCNVVAYSFGANCQAMWQSLSGYIDFPLMTAEAKHQQFAEWNAMYRLPISPFPHFPFLISRFLVPTFRATQFHWVQYQDCWLGTTKKSLMVTRPLSSWEGRVWAWD